MPNLAVISRGPKGGTILKQRGNFFVFLARESAPLSAAAGAAVLRARVGAAQVEVPVDFAIGVREIDILHVRVAVGLLLGFKKNTESNSPPMADLGN